MALFSVAAAALAVTMVALAAGQSLPNPVNKSTFCKSASGPCTVVAGVNKSASAYGSLVPTGKANGWDVLDLVATAQQQQGLAYYAAGYLEVSLSCGVVFGAARDACQCQCQTRCKNTTHTLEDNM